MLARFEGDLHDRKERMQLWLDTLFQKRGKVVESAEAARGLKWTNTRYWG